MHPVKTAAALLCGNALLLATTAVAVDGARPGLKEFFLTGQHAFSSEPPDLALLEPGRIVSGPYAANAYAGYTDPGNWPPENTPYTGWINNSTFAYSGYINIPDNGSNTCFVISGSDGKSMYLDGVRVGAGQWTASRPSVNLDLASGWHEIAIWLSHNSQGAGPPTGELLWHPDRIGFGIDWLGRGGDPLNYEFPHDPGDGSIFIADPPPGWIKVRTIGVDAITATTAELTGHLDLGGGVSGVPRVYFDTEDMGDTPSAWRNAADHSTPLGFPGATITIPVSGLTTGVPYYYRFAFTNESGVTMAGNVLSFTPVSADTPSRFSWNGDRAVTTWDWDDPAGWLNLDGLSRQIPGASVGDTILINAPAGSRTFLITNNITLAGITAGFSSSDIHTITFAPGATATPVTLDLQTLDGSPVAIDNRGLSNLNLGTTPPSGLLAFHLGHSLTFPLNYPITHALNLNAPITGGAPGHTLAFHHNRSDSYSHYRIYLRNADSDFIADMVINIPTYRMLHFFVGFPNINADDRMFGNPANRISSNHPANIIYINAPANGFLFQRIFTGGGTLRCVSVNSSLSHPLENPRPLTFGPAARLEPGIGDTPGTITLIASTIGFDADAATRIRLWPDGISDTLVFQLRSNAFSSKWDGNPALDPTPGTLNLGGRVEFIEHGAAPAGTSWTIATTTYTNTLVTGNFTPARLPGATASYTIRPHQNPDGSWDVIATRHLLGTLLMVQ